MSRAKASSCETLESPYMFPGLWRRVKLEACFGWSMGQSPSSLTHLRGPPVPDATAGVGHPPAYSRVSVVPMLLPDP
jgi:hypothetical protein